MAALLFVPVHLLTYQLVAGVLKCETTTTGGVFIIYVAPFSLRGSHVLRNKSIPRPAFFLFLRFPLYLKDHFSTELAGNEPGDSLCIISTIYL